MTTADQSVTAEEFARSFRDAIRVGLNWERLSQERWPIKGIELNSASQLQRCFVPWYVGPEGNEVNYDFEGAVPLRVTDVPKTIAILNDERQADIHRYVEQFREQHGIVEFTVPTYGLSADEYFILDRNHRMSALTLAPVPFRVTLWNIDGPLDPECLLDLIHWTREAQ